MTKWEFEQIVARDKSRILREDCIGEEWLSPILQLEAEEDRHELILFCGKLANLLKENRNAMAS
jgi:hypothetical protein